MDSNLCKRFISLFRGNNRSYGQLDPRIKNKDKEAWTVKQPLSDEQYFAHLNGEMGLGVVPILDTGLTWWGAIDIDNHGTGVDLDYVNIERKVRAMDLPLIMCRSRSGGVHLYCFGREPLRADMLKTVLTKWMADLGIEGSDCIYPKQSKLVTDSEGNRALGNWLNLPYFNAHDTKRYAFDNGHRCSLDMFVTNAENIALRQEDLDSMFGGEHSEAPPCIQRALREGVTQGTRNEALFHITIYNRKRNPDGAREMSHAMQAEIFPSVLSYSEADKTIRSASKKNYGYLCKKEPWKDWCDKEACRKRKYGISETEYDMLSVDGKLPLFSDLVKYLNTEPVMWEIRMNGVPITMSTEELMDYKAVRVRAMERLHLVLPSKIRAGQWTDEILAELMTKLTFEEAPLESSPVGVLQIRLGEFLRKADLNSTGTDHGDRDALLRGMPVVQMYKGEKYIMFRPLDFEDYLKKTRTDIPRNRTLWYKANKEMGVEFDRVRVKQQVISIWMVKSSQIMESKPSPIDFNPEF